jgi:hypothetical protein
MSPGVARRHETDAEPTVRPRHAGQLAQPPTKEKKRPSRTEPTEDRVRRGPSPSNRRITETH